MAWRGALAFCLAGLGGVCVWAQGGADSANAAQESIHTLHVYMDLIQVPVLVLDGSREPMKQAIDPARFGLSLDSGPVFKPMHVRQEGDDPITLGILLDVTGVQAPLMPRMAEAVAGLAPGSLHARDHVSLYTLDCRVERTLKDAPADALELKAGVERGLGEWMAYRTRRPRPRCENRVHLWDGIAAAIGDMSGLPGRRVLLVVTDGEDHGSSRTWNAVREYAQTSGVAVFGLLPEFTVGMMSSSGPLGRGGYGGREDGFNSICELSGGVELGTDGARLSRQLVKFVEMVRGRYIVEFPRARNESPGVHELVVTIAKSDAYIRPAGVSVRMVDPNERNNPDTIPTDTSGAPELGKRKVLTPQR